jgi:hypothetical protein
MVLRFSAPQALDLLAPSASATGERVALRSGRWQRKQTVQAGLGITTLLLVVPVLLAVAHQTGAILLFTAAVLARHRLRWARRCSRDRARGGVGTC